MAFNFFFFLLFYNNLPFSHTKILKVKTMNLPQPKTEFNPELRKRKNYQKTKSNIGKSKITICQLLRRSFLYQIKDLFKNSTLHGIRYIAEAHRSFGERILWFCFTAISFISAFVIIVNLWEKFQTNPTITGEKNKNQLISSFQLNKLKILCCDLHMQCICGN